MSQPAVDLALAISTGFDPESRFARMYAVPAWERRAARRAARLQFDTHRTDTNRAQLRKAQANTRTRRAGKIEALAQLLDA